MKMSSALKGYERVAGSILRVAIFAAVIVLPTAVPAQQPDKAAQAQELKQQADGLMKEGKRLDAILLYKKAISLNLNFWQAHDALGNAFFKEKMFLDAAMEYGEAMVINPAYSAGYYNMAYSYRKAARYGDAIKNYEKYIKLKSDDTDAYFGLAESYKAVGEKDKAIENYQIYVKKEQRPSEQKWVEKSKAAIAELQGNAPPPVAAIPTPMPPIQPQPGAAAAPGLNQAGLDAQAEKPVKAPPSAAAVSQPAPIPLMPPPSPAPAPVAAVPPPAPIAAAPAPAPAPAPYVPPPVVAPPVVAVIPIPSVSAPAASSRPASPPPQALPPPPPPSVPPPAQTTPYAGVSAVPPPAAPPPPVTQAGPPAQEDPLIAEGDAHIKAGSYHNAVTTYRDAVVRSPNSVEAHYKLGLSLAMTNHLDAAVAEWKRVLEIDPANVGAKDNIAKAEAKLAGTPPPPAAPAPPPPTQQSAAKVEELFQAAVQANNKGDYDAAVAYTDNLFKLKQDHAKAYVVRGDAMLGLGQMDDAVKAYNNAMVFDPTLSAPLFGLAESYRLLANREKSVHYYKLFLQSPDPQKESWRVERATKMIQIMEGTQ